MKNDGVLLCSFVKRSGILSFLENLHNTLRIPFRKIFVFSVDGNTREYLVTFKANSKEDMMLVENSTMIHMKNGCIFSINALNAIIESEKKDKSQSNKDYQINWDRYKGKLIIMVKDKIRVSDIEKIEDKCELLK